MGELYSNLALGADEPVAGYRETGLAENYRATRRATIMADLSISEQIARRDAEAERAEAIERLTGRPFAELYREAGGKLTGRDAAIWRALGTGTEGRLPPARRRAAQEAAIDVIRAGLPEAERGRVMTAEEIDARARALSREAVETSEEIGARADGAGTAGALAGGFVGAMHDPVNLLSLAIGAPARAGILGTALIEGGIGAATETALQPMVQDYRRRIGVRSGVGPALENIAMAGAGGFVLGGGIKAGLVGLEKLAGRSDAALAAEVETLGAKAPDAARGAAQAVRTEDEVTADNPGLPPAAHRGRTQAAMDRAAEGAPATSAGPEAPPVRAPAGPDDDAARPSLPGFEANELSVDARTFQFKQNADAQGVVETLRGVEEWHPEKAGSILVYEYADGRRFIVDGHQRLALARRIKARKGGDIWLYGHVLREADGVTPEYASARAAAKNIASVDTRDDLIVEAAKVMRTAPEELTRVLPPRSNLVKAARGLARLDPRGFGLALNGLVDPAHAAIVGRLIPDDTDRQGAALQVLANSDPENARQAEAIVREVLAAPVARVKELSLFGEEEFAESLMPTRAKVLDRTIKALKRDRTVFATLTREAARVEAAGNRLETDANARRAETDAQAIQTIQTLATRKGPLSDALTDAARRARDDGRFDGAVRDFAEAVRHAVERGDFTGDAVGDIGGVAGRGGRGADHAEAAGEAGAPDGRLAEATAPTAEDRAFETPGGAGQAAQSASLRREIAEHDPHWPEDLPGQLVLFARQVLDMGGRHKRRAARRLFGRVDDDRLSDVVEVLRARGWDGDPGELANARFELNEDQARHILKAHGDAATEATRGQAPIAPEDFARLPEILRHGTVREPVGMDGRTARRAETFEIVADIGGRRHVLLAAHKSVRGKRRRFKILSYWKRDGDGSDGAPLDVRLETPRPTEQNARSESTGIPAAEENIGASGRAVEGGGPAEAADPVPTETADQAVALGERVGEEGAVEPDLRTVAEIEADHAAAEEFVDQLKLCGRDA